VRVRRRILCETGHENAGQEKPRTQTPEHEETFGAAFREAITCGGPPASTNGPAL
jgi:hypothetical protein